MFTGLISDVGEVLEIEDAGAIAPLARRLPLRRRLDPDRRVDRARRRLPDGGRRRARGERTRISVDVGAETLAVTTLAAWRAGDKVNLERSLRVGDELGGHMVSGHVDGVAEILSRRDFDGMSHFTFRAPAALAKFIAVKGSVALDGTSLTVNAVAGDTFEVLLIPHTLAVTTWGARKAGDRVNIEVDQMARYAARLIEAGRGEPASS